MPDRTISGDFPTDLPAWRALEEHFRETIATQTLRGLFDADADRFDKFSIDAAELFLDFSKNFLTDGTLSLLIDLAAECGVREAIDAMFAGAAINSTEGRPALHTALRAPAAEPIAADVSGVSDVWPTLDRMGAFVAGVHAGDIRGHNGKRLTNMVNIGIGGSSLGGVMASRALRHHWRPGLSFYSVSNVDGTELADLSRQLTPDETLFVICSKTFTTRETMSNAHAAREWLSGCLGEAAIGAHFVAASTNHDAMNAFGIDAGRRFGFHDWVGGRYSIWSAVGLSLALVIGMDAFREMLSGANRLDRHFHTAEPRRNMPMLLALIDIWNRNFLGAASKAILPYDQRLDRFPAFLQQLEMESNGKRVHRDGTPVVAPTCPVIWGEPGSDAQHSFYQLLHQGTDMIPVDFILPAQSSGGQQRFQDMAATDCIAQSEALMDGYGPEEAAADLLAAGMDAEEAAALAAHKTHPGNRPSNTILLRRLAPASLGQLIALYEHKVFVQGVIWGINSFDQFGVELGKRLAGRLGDTIGGASNYAGKNPGSAGLIARLQRLRQ